MAVQRLQGGSPAIGLPSSRLVTYLRELSINFKPQCKDPRTVTHTTTCPSTVTTVIAVYVSHILETGMCFWDMHTVTDIQTGTVAHN
jgi:hypothetical protein